MRVNENLRNQESGRLTDVQWTIADESAKIIKGIHMLMQWKMFLMSRGVYKMSIIPFTFCTSWVNIIVTRVGHVDFQAEFIFWKISWIQSYGIYVHAYVFGKEVIWCWQVEIMWPKYFKLKGEKINACSKMTASRALWSETSKDGGRIDERLVCLIQNRGRQCLAMT